MAYTDILNLINSNLASGQKIPAIDHREVEIALLDYIEANLFQSGDIKVIKCDATYLSENFEVNGLGKNLRTGWAICNGNNGTVNLVGRVPIHYSADFPLGTSGGSKDAVLVAHTHSISTSPNDALGYVTAKTSSSTGGTPIQTASAGESGTNKNMQPYLSMVYIMKL